MVTQEDIARILAKRLRHAPDRFREAGWAAAMLNELEYWGTRRPLTCDDKHAILDRVYDRLLERQPFGPEEAEAAELIAYLKDQCREPSRKLA